MKNVIFDLDGTLALIDDRRKISTKPNGKIDWDTFFDPKNIDLDKPNLPVIKMAQSLCDSGHQIVIFSGRSKGTIHTTKQWLNKNNASRPRNKHVCKRKAQPSPKRQQIGYNTSQMHRLVAFRCRPISSRFPGHADGHHAEIKPWPLLP